MPSKILTTLLLIFILLTCLFGYLSYSFYGEKQALNQRLEQSLAYGKGVEELRLKAEESCKIVGSISASYDTSKQEIDKQEKDVVKAIDKLEKSYDVDLPNLKEKLPDVQDNTIDIDGKLPDDLSRVLSEHCLRTKGSACTNP